MFTPAEKANLARIRDNQRRSRARRKEYLQELEQKLRQCELQGVEASAEIQQAARKVAEENRKLRGLLNRNGVSDGSIDSCLKAPVIPTVRDSGLPLYQSGPTSNAVQTLEQLLVPRRPSCLDPNAPFCPSRQVTMSRETSVASVSTASAMWDNSAIQAAPAAPTLPQPSTSSQMTKMPKMPSPQGFTSAVNRTEAGMDLTGLGTGPGSRQGGNTNVSHSSTRHNSQTTQAYNLEMQMQMHNPQTYNEPRHQSVPSPTRGPSSSVYVGTAAPQTQQEGTNCCITTDMISRMTGPNSRAIPSPMECMSHIDCSVDNATFNNTMQRSSATISGT